MNGLTLEDEARLEYSRLLWSNPRTRRRLLFVWDHPDHPHRERFHEQRELVVALLESADPAAYVDSLSPRTWTLRTLTREIPCVIWDLWDESEHAATALSSVL
jgi:hypothetical protein